MYRGPLPVRIVSRVLLAVVLGTFAAATTVAADLQGGSAGLALALASGAAIVVMLVFLVKRVSQRRTGANANQLFAAADRELDIGTLSDLGDDLKHAMERFEADDEQCAVSVIRVGSTSEDDLPLDEATITYLSSVLRDLPRANDSVYRLDGRIFAVLLTSCGRAGAESFRDRLRTRFSSEVVPSELGGGLTSSSVGVATLTESTASFDAILRLAKEDLVAYESAVDRQVAAVWGSERL